MQKDGGSSEGVRTSVVSDRQLFLAFFPFLVEFPKKKKILQGPSQGKYSSLSVAHRNTPLKPLAGELG